MQNGLDIFTSSMPLHDEKLYKNQIKQLAFCSEYILKLVVFFLLNLQFRSPIKVT